MENSLIGYLALGFALGWFFGSLWTTIRQAQAFKNILKDLGVTTEQLLALKDRMDREDEEESTPQQHSAAQPVVEVRLEQHNGQIYAYRKSTEEFLAQGENREELIERLTERFKRGDGARLIIREEDGADLVKTLQ